MFRKNMLITAITAALIINGGLALADDHERDRDRLHDPETSMDQDRDEDRDRDRDRDQDQDRDQDKIYGSQLMTKQERNEYRKKMREAENSEERAQIRNEHHNQMRERAKEQGITLPNDPPSRRDGMMRRDGSGMGSGGGRR